MQVLFRDTKLRIIEFSFHSRKDINDDIEELVKKEIFNRYNSGITPLKPTEIDNAIYNEDDLNSFLKKKLQEDKTLSKNVSNVFHFEKNDIEVILKKIRQLLVQHEVPIKYYAVKKQTIISKFYDGLFAKIDPSEIDDIYFSFTKKIEFLTKLKNNFTSDNRYSYNRLISETIFWGLSILESEDIEIEKYNNEEFVQKTVDYLYKNIEAFTLQRSSFSKEIYYRYSVIADFLEERFDLKLSNIYLNYNQDFKQRNKEIAPEKEEIISFDDLRINKPEPSSIAIMDICRQMNRQKFLIRPQYQRKEVINRKKSSSIIESIILGIKLPPIFVYKREDRTSEVVDGQQRLLSILAFIGEPYLDENNDIKYSNKNNFPLYLKNGILKDLHGSKFKDLSLENQEKIKNFDLWIIEIDYKNNKNFEPIDLFVRLNNKPYPIKDDTFEMWNSYISRDIIDTIKSVHSNNSDWFYFRKNNSRMEDENIYTALAYFQFCRLRDEGVNSPYLYYPREMDIYKIGNKINFRLKSKVEITRVLENPSLKDDFIKAINHFEFEFIRKLKNLISDDINTTHAVLSKNLDDMLMVANSRRTQQSFYALWYFLFDIPFQSVDSNRKHIRENIKELFVYMSDIEDKSTFERHVLKFKENYITESHEKKVDFALLKDLSNITSGINTQEKKTLSSTSYYFANSGDLSIYKLNKKRVVEIEVNNVLTEIFDSKSKILISKINNYPNRLSVIYVEDKLAFSNDIIGVVINRPLINPKYVSILLMSRLYFHKYFEKKSKGSALDNVSLIDLEKIEIPILPADKQFLFELIYDYIFNSPQNSKISLFYERIMDAMVYELFFQKEFIDSNIVIGNHISQLCSIKDMDSDLKNRTVEETYYTLSSPNHKIGADLIKLMNISSVREIESKI